MRTGTKPKRETPAVPAEAALPRAARATIALIHVVCPLLFFTNLTRNPYFTQIALLNIGLALCGLFWAVDTFRRGEWRVPTFPFGLPMACFLGAALLSSVLSFIAQVSVRPGLAFEMTRVWIFTLINCAIAVFLPALYTRPLGAEPERRSIWVDLVLAFLWSACWLVFHDMKNPDPAQTMWDPYGAFLWVLAAVYAVSRTRKGDALSFFHLIFAVSFVAGAYGVLQYWGRDIIWTSPVQPYGGRPVSTFGNPNFLSSYLMMVCPVAITFSLRDKTRERWGYLFIAVLTGLGVLSTLTRSTYVGLVVALIVTALAYFRKGEVKLTRPFLIALGIFVGLVLVFPATPVMRAQSPLARFTEIFEAMKSGASYAPWHQRILIWSSAWDMMRGRWLFGRGWGAFELFYPFFQGKYLLVRKLAVWRTHANNAHNILLEFWSQTGTLGVGLVLWAFVAMVVGGWFATRRSTGAGRAATAALLGGIVGMVADNFFGNVSIFFAVPAFLFWWNVGALFNEERPTRVWTAPLSDGVGRLAVVVIAAVCVLGGAYYFLRWEEETFYFRGFKQAKTTDVNASIASLETAFHWFPGDVNNNYELGNSLSRFAHELSDRGLAEEARHQNEKALIAFDHAIKANPGYDEIYFNRGITLVQLDRKPDGAASLEMSLFINPILKDAYASLASLYISMEKIPEASDVLKRAAETFPDDKDFWNNLGYTYTRLGRHAEAFDAYKQALLIDPNFSRAWGNIHEAAQASGKRDPILEVPDLVNRMSALLKARDLPGALKAAQRIVDILPDSPDAHVSVANVDYYMGKTDQAIAELQTSLKLSPDFEAAHANLGKVYASTRQFALARQELARAVELNPSDADAKKALDSLPQ